MIDQEIHSKCSFEKTKHSNPTQVAITQCGYFKHPSDVRFGASPDGVSTRGQQFLV